MTVRYRTLNQQLLEDEEGKRNWTGRRRVKVVRLGGEKRQFEEK